MTTLSVGKINLIRYAWKQAFAECIREKRLYNPTVEALSFYEFGW